MSGQILEVQYLCTRNKGLSGPAKNRHSMGTSGAVSGNKWWESVLPLPKRPPQALQQSLLKLLWKDRKLMTQRQACCNILAMGGGAWECHWLTERLAFLGQSLMRYTMWGQKVTEDFSHQKLKPKTESCQTLKGKGLFVCNLPGSRNLSRFRKKLYRELVVGSASDSLEEWLGRWLEEICSK